MITGFICHYFKEVILYGNIMFKYLFLSNFVLEGKECFIGIIKCLFNTIITFHVGFTVKWKKKKSCEHWRTFSNILRIVFKCLWLRLFFSICLWFSAHKHASITAIMQYVINDYNRTLIMINTMWSIYATFTRSCESIRVQYYSQ